MYCSEVILLRQTLSSSAGAHTRKLLPYRPVKFLGLFESSVARMNSADERNGNFTPRIKVRVPAGAPAIRRPQEQDLVENF
jgi:hypothetical protein